LINTGGQLTTIAAETKKELDAFLPPHWSRANPVDILGDAGADRYAKSLEIAARDPNADGMLVILTPQDMTDPTAIAEGLAPYAKLGKPVLASWMGGKGVEGGKEVLNKAGIPVFPFPDTAARVFNYMWKYTESLKEMDGAVKPVSGVNRAAAEKLIQGAMKEGRTLLDEAESKQLLAAYGIPVVRTEVATNADEAAKAADAIGYPIVLKLYSRTITHKTDVGGVKLNLKDAAAVKEAFTQIKTSVLAKCKPSDFMGVTVQPMIKLADAYEIILGSSIDPQFGPVMLFGSGGQLVEVFKDRALGLPPLNAKLARQMMDRTKINKVFDGVRGRPAIDRAKFEDVLVRFSELLVEQRRIKELDINPMLVSHEGIMAVDARVILFPADVTDDKLPVPAMVK